jgi:uroporphyrinogen decarboxylase
MNDKERFHAIMNFESADRTLYWEQGFWGGTVERWYQEGMPKVDGVHGSPAFGDTVRGPATPVAPGDRICHDVRESAGLDMPSLRAPVEMFMYPGLSEQILDEDGTTFTVRDEIGIVKRVPKDKGSIPQFLSWPVSCFEDFEKLAAEHLDPEDPGRFPVDWERQIEQLNHYQGVVAIGGHPCGFFGAPRYLMGEMALLMGFLDTPELIKQIIDHLAELWVALYSKILSEVKVDCIHIWEDMSFKNGPLISPALFEEFMLPAYRRVTETAKGFGVDIVLVDTDGDCRLLIPLFLEGGVTGIYPFEVQAGMDVQEIRETFPRLQILGGVDKKELARGPAAIDREIRRRIPGMVERGGFIPMGDHQIPPDVSWENYLYYRRRLAEIAEKEG